MKLKLFLYLVFLVQGVWVGMGFYDEYQRVMEKPENQSSADLTEVVIPEDLSEKDTTSKLGLYGGWLFASVLCLGLLIARDVSFWVAQRTVTAVYDLDGEPSASSRYEEAEKEWANGNHLEAIQMLRDYLKKHPREVHAKFRIAEIYEKDMANILAAALEYEDILDSKLPRERWGWSAIHLCNLYLHMNQQDKLVNLLSKIDRDYGETAAAKKARKRLAIIEGREYNEEEDA